MSGGRRTLPARTGTFENQAMSEADSAELLERWRAGEQRAAELLFERYVQRLLALARTRLPQGLGRRLDPEDVVQSAFRSFFVGARDGKFLLQRSGDMWRLLVAITLHKLKHQVEHHTAAKRAVGREAGEEAVFGPLGIPVVALANDPSPEHLLALAEELDRILQPLDSLERRMLELRLNGHTLNEIADATQRSERTVRRLLDWFKQQLEVRLGGSMAS
jgi:RNA polymerase sigma factor (sigma-70 family)